MNTVLSDDTWVWTIIQEPEKSAEILGQHDTTNDIKFIPTFLDKDSALICLNRFTKNESSEFEPQAIFYSDLLVYAGKNGFILYILDKNGEFIDKVAP